MLSLWMTSCSKPMRACTRTSTAQRDARSLAEILSRCSTLMQARDFVGARREADAAITFHQHDATRMHWDLRLEIDAAWLADHSLVAVALDSERAQWDSVGLSFSTVET